MFKLDPFIENGGLIRVGGRLKKSDLDQYIAHPILLPKKSPESISILQW